MFTHPLATKTDAPVLLEAFHYQFHPSWQKFLQIIRESEGAVKHVSSQQYVPKGVMPINDIRFSYKCAGGSLMDLGTYALSTVRMVLGANNKVLPIDVQSRLMPLINGNQAEPKIDQAITASFLTESGQRGLIVVDLASQGGWPSFLPESWTANIPTTGWPKCEAVLEEVQVQKEEEGRPGHVMQRTVIIWNYLVPTIYHRIEICDRHYLRVQGVEVKYWKETKYQTAYTSAEERSKDYQDWWTTWRCQLEEFVNQIKGRPGSGVWIDGQESILQMEAIDGIYRESGLGPRPTSTFRT